MRSALGLTFAAVVGVLISAATLSAAPTPPTPPTPPAPKAPKGPAGPGGAAAAVTTSIPSYGLGTESFISTIGPGGVPSINGSTAISSSTPVTAGTLTTTQLANGDISVSFVQGFNDNTYGTNASPLWGSKGHTFNDLLGSDKGEFKFTDSKGNVVLDFDVDYIAKTGTSPVQIAPGLFATYASGYGTAGVLGGDGKVLSGSASNIKAIDTTFSDDLNNPAFINAATLVNSPTSAGWNKVNGYSVVISAAAFGTNGFGSVSIPGIHDSPARPFANPVPLPPTVWTAGLLALGVVAFKLRRPVAV